MIDGEAFEEDLKLDLLLIKETSWRGQELSQSATSLLQHCDDVERMAFTDHRLLIFQPTLILGFEAVHGQHVESCQLELSAPVCLAFVEALLSHTDRCKCVFSAIVVVLFPLQSRIQL